MVVLGEKIIMKNLRGIKSEQGSLLSFVVVMGFVGCKCKHRFFTIQYVISCNNILSMHLLLESGKVLYAVSSN